MIESVLQAIDAEILFSNLLGGVIALLIAVWVSRREFNRQARQKRKNWYRSVHNLAVQGQGAGDIDQRTRTENNIRKQAQQYQALAEQVQNSLPGAPTDEVGFELFNTLQNIEMACLSYVNEAESPDINRVFLQNHHDRINTFCLIAQYLIEDDFASDREFLDELDGEELEQAEEDYQEWADGTLFTDDTDEGA